jgi:hypothetical protein
MIPVEDPFNARNDPELPGLLRALDPNEAKRELKRRLPRLSGDGKLRLKAIRVTRYKSAKRCVVEYDVEQIRPGFPVERSTILGKTRARRFGNEAFRLLDEFWSHGFDDESEDNISVPEPLGVIASMQMWFQRKVPGQMLTELLSAARGVEIARNVADAIHKVHTTGVAAEKRHDMADELRILHECLAKVRLLRPQWASRVEGVERACDQLAASVPLPRTCGIHRDFYSSQVILDGSRFYLIDFDLYCMGDPALDVGNFLGHMDEQALRESGSPVAVAEQERALLERFASLAGRITEVGAHAYAVLTLARHVYLSTQFADRQHLTESMLQLCEERLGL